MKTRLLGLAVVLVALAVIVNALALQSAQIDGNTLKASIVNTNQALVAVVSGASQDADVSFNGDATSASISVNKGIQANATYQFGQAFGIKNNSNDAIKVSLTVQNGSGATVTLTPSTAGPVTPLTDIPLAPGATVYFTLKLQSGAGAAASSTDYNIVIDAAKQ